MLGNIHSLESFGTVDGPGIRYVIFLQGCPLRCKYCHNPDTHSIDGGKKMSVEDILKKYKSVKAFARGGITVTGGEPLLQIAFLTELFTECKKQSIHTCLDTSGYTFSYEKKEEFDALMEVTDLVLLDIKHIDEDEHKELTKVSNKSIIEFAKYLSLIGKPVYIRHVVIPTITLNDNYLVKLGEFLGTLKNVKALDILPYHTMANQKYDNLNIKVPLEGIEPATIEQAIYARQKIIEGIKKTLHNKK